MFEWIQQNIDKILIAVGAGVILFWPKIKEKVLQSSPSSASQGTQNPSTVDCPCQTVAAEPEEQLEDTKRSSVVVEVMKIKAFCERRRLKKAEGLCDQLACDLVHAKPEKPTPRKRR
jgi:hypothetical protein|tara:strand:- start:2473 stop:2823 length:351 start_codon:yes stop_codon:yes gene_type:complete